MTPPITGFESLNQPHIWLYVHQYYLRNCGKMFINVMAIGVIEARQFTRTHLLLSQGLDD
jgi:hypothetical protein